MIRGVTLFVAGLAVGLGVHVAVAQNANSGVRMMNHAAFVVADPEEAARYYREKMGYREGFRSYNAQGQVSMIYMQISRDTFIELNRATPERAPGFTHYGLWVDDTKAAVEMFRKRGLKVTDPMTSVHRPTPGGPEMPGAVLANIEDPYMRRIELVQPSTQQRRAIESWKD